MLKLGYLFHLNPVLAAHFLDVKLQGLWHLDPFPAIPFLWAAKTCYKRMAPAGLGMIYGDALSSFRPLC